MVTLNADPESPEPCLYCVLYHFVKDIFSVQELPTSTLYVGFCDLGLDAFLYRDKLQWVEVYPL
jgi:hypothetical protein